jgi:hypothetical protein
MNTMILTVVRVLVGGTVGAGAHLMGGGALLLKSTAQVLRIIGA